MINSPILDACCGGKMFYFDKHDDRVLFQDIRKLETTLCVGRHFEVAPDVQADFTDMPYPNDCFSMVVFDPPHLLRNISDCKMQDIYDSPRSKSRVTGYQMIKYGALGNADWKDVLHKGFVECFRILKPGGFLIFKWNEQQIPTEKIIEVIGRKPLFGHTSSKGQHTIWMCFIK